MQILTNYPSTLQRHVKLVGGITGLTVACHLPKVTKKTRFCNQRSKMLILPIFGDQLRKNCELLPLNF